MEMLSFRTYSELLDEAKKPSLAKTATVSSDDKGKMHELLLAKHLNGGKLPEHHRAISDNPDHSGTPEQVHDKLRKKIGEEAYNEIESHSKQTAEAVKSHLKKEGYLGGKGGHTIQAVHWTSNRDTEGKAGDHEKTTGAKDVNSNADIILTTKNKKGETKFHGISAKYGSGEEPNYRNDGLASLEKKAGAKAGSYSAIQKQHEKHMESIGYKGSKVERHAQYKEDKKVLDAEKEHHKNSGSVSEFQPKSEAAKRAHLGELSSQEARSKMARLHEKSLGKMNDAELREHIRGQVSAPTIHNHIVAHSHVQLDGSAHPIVRNSHNLADEHLDNYKDLKVRKGNGISAEIIGTHKETGKQKVVAQQIFKATSGPHKGMAGAFKLRG